ncbi:hypothetical protein RM572_04450 [Streptomyces sp. DSM 42041]|uniref:Integral membrane protein n=1 Tax=Streptomyces hazeniae TaxID=3075538 RepID=A0ABU2NM09_9ACTN|nr:hypothetical protein [Streptomyces sp. DSM 42041]MDT0378026.1 hypothetical protein [Streptomyces sp. DSM 42041]
MTSRHPHRRAPEGTPPPSGPDRKPAGPPGQAEPAEPVAPVNPGAWDTRSWTLVDDVDGPPAESGPEPLDSWRSEAGAGATPESGVQVVWPEAGHPSSAALDAEGVPLAEPPTGPLHALDGPPPRRRAAATPTRAPSPAPPAPETRLHTGSVGPAQPPAPDEPAAPRPPSDAPPEPGGPAPGVRVTGRRAPAPDVGARPPFAGEPGRPDRAGAAPAADAAAPSGGGTSRADGGRRGASADPVRELMHRHRALCERAVDPLEIAAGLEAHGITDRTAARYRHRDVFSLAEELYVRVPRAEDGAAAEPSADGSGPHKPRRARAAGRGLSHLLPGVLCAATVVGLTYVPLEPPYARPAVGTLGGLAVLAAVRLSLRGVPRTRTAALWACWLLGYVLYGDWLLTELLAGGAGVGRLLPAFACLCVPLALAFGVAPAAWSAHLFATRARRRLTGSRSLGDFAAGVRPLLLLTVGLFAVALSAVQVAAHLLVRGAAAPHATQAATAALGVLLFVALLLSRHGFPRAASGGLAAACLLIAAALGTVLAARLPGAAAVGRPVEQAVAAYGPTVVPAAACALAALALLAYGLRALTGASAHQRPAAREASGRLPRQGPAPGPAPTGVEPGPPGDRLARQAR